MVTCSKKKSYPNLHIGYEPRVGDLVLVWGRKWTDKLVKYLIKKMFGVTDPPNHVQMTVSQTQDVSAEPQGVMYMDRLKTFDNSRRIVILRYKKITKKLEKEMSKEYKKYIGKPYDYFLFIIWMLQIYLALLPFIPYTASKWYKWLKKKEEHAWACSELTAQLAETVFGTYMGADDHMFQSPHFQHGLGKSCPCLWEIVFEMERA